MELSVSKYDDMEKCVRAFADGRFQTLVIVGGPGQCKTTTVRKVLGDTALFFSGGQISAYRIYIELYNNRDRPFVLDDMDGLYHDRDSVRLLKALCDTHKEREVGWYTHNRELDALGVPRAFKTKTRVVLILNKSSAASPHVEALGDRGLVVHFQPPVEEVLKVAGRFFRDTQVLKYVRERRGFIRSLSLRSLIVASEMRKAGLDPAWQDALAESLGVKSLELVARLLADPQYLLEEDRVRAFHEQTARDGKLARSRSSYFEHKRRLADARKEAADAAPPATPRRRRVRQGATP